VPKPPGKTSGVFLGKPRGLGVCWKGGREMVKQVESVDTITQIETLDSGKEHSVTIDRKTGEIVSESWRVFRKSPGGKQPKSVSGQPPFARVWMTNLIQIVKQKKLSNSEAGLLFKLMAFLDWQGTMLVHPEKGYAANTNEIAAYLGMNADYFAQQIENLCQKGLIGKFSAGKGRPYRYHFNCNLAFFGSRMNDPRDYDRFNRDCAYEPKINVKYKMEIDETKMKRKDF
jgi:hypothetical protein